MILLWFPCFLIDSPGRFLFFFSFFIFRGQRRLVSFFLVVVVFSLPYSLVLLFLGSLVLWFTVSLFPCASGEKIPSWFVSCRLVSLVFLEFFFRYTCLFVSLFFFGGSSIISCQHLTFLPKNNFSEFVKEEMAKIH